MSRERYEQISKADNRAGFTLRGGPWLFGIFSLHSHALNIGEDQKKKNYRSNAGSLILCHMVNPAIADVIGFMWMLYSYVMLQINK